ncbi:MAG: hypothetical protein GY811_08030 [Myxococcales bacterium]|nr:hypothetical protein [Myxococcales bacterium]
MRRLLLSLVGTTSVLACATGGHVSTFKRTYAGGQVLFEMEMKDGVPEGRATAYHPNGTVRHQGNYKSGNRDGLFHYWDDKGGWLKQELFASDKLVWASRVRADYPSESLLEAEVPVAVSKLSSAQRTATTAIEELQSAKLAGHSSPASVDVESSVPGTSNTRFLNGLPAHGSFVQLSIGRGSSVSHSSAQRIGARGSLARGRLGGSFALTATRFDDEFVTAFGKPVADLQVSYLLPYHTGNFVARTGVVVPLGNDSNKSALAGAASVVQAPNDAIYVLPSNVAMRGSLSWLFTSEHVISQIDLGIDVALFGYPEGVHPIVHANGAIGVGTSGFFVGAEGSTALAWTGTLTDVALLGGALYGTVLDTTVGLFAGRQDDATIVRVRTAYDANGGAPFRLARLGDRGVRAAAGRRVHRRPVGGVGPSGCLD